jgi:hypothetical protein
LLRVFARVRTSLASERRRESISLNVPSAARFAYDAPAALWISSRLPLPRFALVRVVAFAFARDRFAVDVFLALEPLFEPPFEPPFEPLLERAALRAGLRVVAIDVCSFRATLIQR